MSILDNTIGDMLGPAYLDIPRRQNIAANLTFARQRFEEYCKILVSKIV